MFRCQETPRQKQETLKRLPLSSRPETLGCSPRGTGGGGCGDDDVHHPDKNVCHRDPDRDKLVKTEQDGCFIRARITRRRVTSGGWSRLYITEVVKRFKNSPPPPMSVETLKQKHATATILEVPRTNGSLQTEGPGCLPWVELAYQRVRMRF